MNSLIPTFLLSLILPVIMLILGLLARMGYPREIRRFLGYHTARSAASQDSWTFAHQVLGKLWLRLSSVFLLLTLVAAGLLRHHSRRLVLLVFVIFFMAELLSLLFSFCRVESALKEMFDNDDNGPTF